MNDASEESLLIMSEALRVGSPDYWTRLEHQAAVAALPEVMRQMEEGEWSCTEGDIAAMAISQAHALIARLKEET